MEDFSLISAESWQPLEWLGYTHPLLTLSKDTIIHTWAAIGVCSLIALIGRAALKSASPRLRYGALAYVEFFDSMLRESAGRSHESLTVFIATLGTFILICNLMVLLPGGEEPTKDLNTTVACALIAFFVIQATSIRSHGLRAYLSEYFKIPFSITVPTGIGSLLMLPLKLIINSLAAIVSFPFELLSKFSLVISLSFRLFGNIFGGALIGTLFKQAIARSIITQIMSVPFGVLLALFFGLFEGGVQAYIFSVLTATYLGMVLMESEKHDQ
jgi:F-type H+-transporting ATPase subunit a